MTTLARPTAPAPPEAREPDGRMPAWGVVGVGLVLAVAVALRFTVRSDLWLDEALTVDIARLPLSRIPDALRHDGAPPLYYLLLHGWMAAFGTGDAAVRALSGVASVATLPVLWLVGRRLGGRAAAWATLLVAASSPFAIRYATEARMYSLVVLECSLGMLAVVRAVERPTWRRLVAVSVAAAALLLTHYWSFHLLAVVVAGLALWGRRRSVAEGGAAARRVAAAVALGAVAFVPWLPSFLFQVAHTGTPWGRPPRLGALVDVLGEFAGGGSDEARLLGLGLFALVVLALFGRPTTRGVELRLPPRTVAATLAATVLGTAALGIAATRVTGSAFVARYLAVVLPPFLLLAALGAVTFAGTRARAAALAVVSALGLAVGARQAGVNRTQAGEVAAEVAAAAGPGDVVAFCPDQLGPAVVRLLARTPAADVPQVGFPRGGRPEVVDWVDYERAVRGSDPERFARRLVEQAGPGNAVWLYWGKGYRPFGQRCAALARHLGALSAEDEVVRRPKVRTRFEHGTLSRFRVGASAAQGAAATAFSERGGTNQ